MPKIDPKALRTAMDMAGITPSQLATKVGVTTSYVARIAQGHRDLKRNPVLRRKIAEELGVPVRWIEHSEEGIAS